MLQEHKCKGHTLDNLRAGLMSRCTRWVLEADPGKKSWLKPNAPGKGGLSIIISSQIR